MTQEDGTDDGLPAGFEKITSEILGAIDDSLRLDGPWHGYVEEFDLIDPADGTEYTLKNGSLQGKWGREVGILAESVDVPDDVPLDPRGWIIEYTAANDGRHVRGTVVSYDGISDSQSRTYYTLYFVPDLSSDPNRNHP